MSHCIAYKCTEKQFRKLEKLLIEEYEYCWRGHFGSDAKIDPEELPFKTGTSHIYLCLENKQLTYDDINEDPEEGVEYKKFPTKEELLVDLVTLCLTGS